MTTVSWVLLTVTLVVAGIDWWSVSASSSVEYWAKPLTMVVLIGLAVTLDHHDDRGLAVMVWFVLALFFSLLGDVLLMLPEERFLGGLGMFLAAHLAYLGGLTTAGVDVLWLAIGAAMVGVALATVGRRVRAAVAAKDASMLVPVTLYIGAISLMVLAAIGTGAVLAIAGALLFMTSDALLAGNKFLQPLPGGRVAVHVTYHLGQLGLILSIPAIT